MVGSSLVNSTSSGARKFPDSLGGLWAQPATSKVVRTAQSPNLVPRFTGVKEPRHSRHWATGFGPATRIGPYGKSGNSSGGFGWTMWRKYQRGSGGKRQKQREPADRIWIFELVHEIFCYNLS